MGFNFGSFAGGLSDSLSEQQRLAAQQQAERQNILAQMAWGNALGGTMAAPPQQNNPIQSFLAKIGLGGAQPPVAQPQQPQQPGPIGGQPMPSAPPPGAQPQGGRLGGAPPVPQAQSMQPQSSPQSGAMTLDQAVARIKQYNPGISPNGLVAAVGQALPYLNAQAQQQYKQIAASYIPMNFDEKVRHNETMEGQGNSRINQGNVRLQQTEERLNLARQRLSATTERHDKDLLEKQFEFDSAGDSKARKAAFLGLDRAVRAKRAALQSFIQASGQTDPDLKPQLIKDAQAQLKEADSMLEAARAKAAEENSEMTPKRVDPNAPKRTNRFSEPEGAPSSSNPPKAGDVLDGYRFKGGDPGNKDSWEKV